MNSVDIQATHCLTAANIDMWSLCYFCLASLGSRWLSPPTATLGSPAPQIVVWLESPGLVILFYLPFRYSPRPPASCDMKFPQIARNHTDSSSLMLWPCYQSDHLFWLFLDSPRFACCLGLPSGYCHPLLFKESQGEQYGTSLSIACGLYLASS